MAYAHAAVQHHPKFKPMHKHTDPFISAHSYAMFHTVTENASMKKNTLKKIT